jgi:zinc protease
MKPIVVTNHSQGYVASVFAFEFGAVCDPPQKAGLANVMARMLMKGTARFSRAELAEELDFLGSSFGIVAGHDWLQMTADCSTPNLSRLMELLHEMLVTPTFPQEELDKTKRQVIAETAEMKDSDSSAAQLFFGQQLFQSSRYARPTCGFQTTVESLARPDVESCFQESICRANLVAGMAGDLELPEAEQHAARVADSLRPGCRADIAPPPVDERKGLDVLLVTRPGRSQAQVMIGQMGVPGSHPDLIPLRVVVSGFGGMFTSRLVQEIREKRGWSYGVSASLDPGRHAGLFTIRFAPSNGDVAPAIQLTCELLASLVRQGLGDGELSLAKDYLANQFPFWLDTPPKKLDSLLNVRMTGKPSDYLETFVERVRAVTAPQAGRAIASLLRPADMCVTVLGDPSLEKRLASLPGVARFRTVPVEWDRDLPD